MRELVGYWTEVLLRLKEKVMIGAWVLTSLIMAVSGPFGNYAVMSFPERLLFWGGLTTLALFVGLAVGVLVEMKIGAEPHWPVALISASSVTVLIAPPLRWASEHFTRVTGDTAPAFGEIEAFVFFMSLGICSIRQLALIRNRAMISRAPASTAGSEDHPEVRLLARLDPELRAPVQWVTVRDHYVDVCTQKGQASLLMRFSDAIAELDGWKGLRIHRSQWVADAAVVAVERDSAKMVVVTADGARLPVSRTYREAVESRCFAKGKTVAEAQA